jgi:hypothetical protein
LTRSGPRPGFAIDFSRGGGEKGRHSAAAALRPASSLA